jgi:hypothetical protein
MEKYYETMEAAGMPRERVQDPRSISAQQRIDIMMAFLPEADRGELEKEATGTALLLEMPINVLARNFLQCDPPDKFPGYPWCIRIQNGNDLDSRMSDTCDRFGWNKKYREFFSGMKGVKLASDGLGYVFYNLAVDRNPNDTRVLMVKKAIAHPNVRTPSRLFKIQPSSDPNIAPPNLEAAKEAYIKLVTDTARSAAASNDKRLLRDYMLDKTGLRDYAERETAQREFSERRDVILAEGRRRYSPTFDIKLEGDVVKWGPMTIPDRIAETPVKKFNKKSAAQLIDAYHEWQLKPDVDRNAQKNPIAGFLERNLGI